MIILSKAIFFINTFIPLQTVHGEVTPSLHGSLPSQPSGNVSIWLYSLFFSYSSYTMILPPLFMGVFASLSVVFSFLFSSFFLFFMIPIENKVQEEERSSSQQNNVSYTLSWASSYAIAMFPLADFIKGFLTPCAGCCIFFIVYNSK